MSFTIEFCESLMKCEFNSAGVKQRILVDILLKYSDMEAKNLARILDTSVENLQDVLDGRSYFEGYQAQDLAQIFLVFFGNTFLNKCTLIRDFS